MKQYPEIVFSSTNSREKLIVLLYPTKEEALTDYDELSSHNFCWYKDGDNIKISLRLKNGYIELLLSETTKNDPNFYWLTNHELTHITTASYEVGIGQPNPSIYLNRQVLCP